MNRCRAVFLLILLWAASGCNEAAPQPPATKSTASEPAKDTKVHTPQVPAEKTSAPFRPSTGPELYAQHCAACHGDRGDGQGIAARFLFPKPRNLRLAAFRLVSTASGVPSPEDMEAVLVRGMPGSAMPSWAHLSPQERRLIVDEVLRLRRDGIREDYIKQLKDQGEEQIDEKDVQQFVDSRTTPGPPLEVPPIGASDAASIARGKALYVKQSCNSCHGNEGRGDGQQKMVDAEGLPTRPRDLTRGIYKGSPEPASFYRRIALGMPGSPMPASSNLKPAEIVDLLNFLRSLSTEEQRNAAVLRRQQIVARYSASLPDKASAADWEKAATTRLRITPLWWRDDFEPDVTVQALHDGRTLAVKLSWRDATSNDTAVRTEGFRDAVAIELFGGRAEPFLGMGSTTAPVDIWFWQAEPPSGPPSVEQVYPRTTVDIYPLSEKSVATASYDRPGTKRDNQPEISLPAEASGNPVVPRSHASGESSLTAGGPGSVTFRLPKSRLVTARGQWDDCRWTVVMTRPLEVPADAGVSLTAGQRASLALAVWDGAHRDRNGQKSITIWHDLVLEKRTR